MKIPNLTQDPTGRTFLLQTALRSLGFPIATDNWFGPKTERALSAFQHSLTGEDAIWFSVKASSFADPADVRSFSRCKASGKTDMQCFAVGDNGIGKWGHNTAQETTPMAAVPRDIWTAAGKTGGAKLQVRRGNLVVDGILGDTMPSLANIRNGAGIDLNPAFAKALSLQPPFFTAVEWRWV